jgi:major membrane immunogen (membrane-anchored lipoprotein)
MKKIVVSVFAVALLVACNGKQSNEHSHDHGDGTHQHEGEEAHDHHDEAHSQEEFTVGNDTVKKDAGNTHDHGDGHGHQH